MNCTRHRRGSFATVTIFLLSAFLFSQILSAGESRAGTLYPRGNSGLDILDTVDALELERIVRNLSGVETIYLDGQPFTIATRYAYSPQKILAAEYLVDEIELLGYEPVVQRFPMRVTVPHLSGIASAYGGDTLWVGDFRNGAIYRAVESDGWDEFAKVGSVGGDIYDVKTGPFGRLWAACGLPTGGLGALFFSSDGGVHWTRRDPVVDVRMLFTITFSSSTYGVAAGISQSVLRTEDGGLNWEVVSPSMFGPHALYGSASSGETHFWLVSQGGYLYESTDGCVNWTERSLSFRQLLDIDFFGSLYGVVVGNGVVYYTWDGGASWNEVAVPVELRSVNMADSLRVVAGGSRGEVYSSENGGVDWNRIDGVCPGSGNILDVLFMDRDTAWIASGDTMKRFYLVPPSAPECVCYAVADTLWGENVIFSLEGKEEPNNKIVLTAHYDSQSNNPMERAPGADDNASGVASVLECARALRDAWTESTVEFVLFDGEEVGFWGSYDFVSHIDTSDYELVINLDMLGYDMNNDMSMVLSGRADQSDSAIALTVLETVDSLELAVVPRFLTGQNLASDQMQFWDAGIPGLLFIEGTRTELNPFYHTTGDLPQACNFTYMAECARAALATVAVFAGYRPLQPAPESVALEQNYPNPFSSTTRVSFVLPRPMDVELVVYDVSGRSVAHVFGGYTDSAEIEWDGTDDSGRGLGSGIYFMRLVAGTEESVRKIVIVR